jgi:hypothetical protein
MKSRPRLGKLGAEFEQSLARSRRTFSAAFLTRRQRESRVLIGALCVDLLNQWSNFSREFFFSVVHGTWSASSGDISVTKIAPGDRRTAIDLAVRTNNAAKNRRPAGTPWERKDEPKWYVHADLRRALDAIGATNLAQFDRAFALGVRAHRTLPAFRNYFAHKNRDTSDAARNMFVQYMIPDRLPTEGLCTVPFNASEVLFLDWITELSLLSGTLCE